MSVTIGFSIGQECSVVITEEHGGAKQITMIDPLEFLSVSGLGIYFYQLKPAFAKAFKDQLKPAVKPRRGQIIGAGTRIGGKNVDQEKTSK